MHFSWYDYNPKTMSFIENWLDESAIKATGLDEGFCDFYEYWASEDRENFWCKVVFENDTPFAVIAFSQYEQVIFISEILIAPEKRGQGKGSKLLKEFLDSEEIIGFPIQKSEAVIYPDNIASQKAFEKAGFKYHSTNKDEMGESLNYVYENFRLFSGN